MSGDYGAGCLDCPVVCTLAEPRASSAVGWSLPRFSRLAALDADALQLPIKTANSSIGNDELRDALRKGLCQTSSYSMPPPQQRPSPFPRLSIGPPSSGVTPKTQTPNVAPVKRQTPPVAVAPTSDTHFTVFVRLPFPRNGFIDPAPVSRWVWGDVDVGTSRELMDIRWTGMLQRTEHCGRSCLAHLEAAISTVNFPRPD